MPRRTAALVIMICLVLYTLLVGAVASVVRAAVMGIAYLIGLRLLGRQTWALAVLFVAAFLMTLFDPNAVWDIGFQLSFAATLGLLLYATPWTRQLGRGTEALLSPAMLTRAAAAGATVLRTDEVGTVEVVRDGEWVWWRGERE